MYRPPRLIKESFVVTILTLLTALLVFIFPLNLKVFNPVKKAFKKIDLLDIYYSHIKAEKTGFGEQKEVVLLNIGKLNRQEIGDVIEKLNGFDPKVIAVDVGFIEKGNDSIDNPLREVLTNAKGKLVFASRLDGGEVTGLNSFFGDFNEGYANLIAEGDPAFSPVRKVNLKKGDYRSLAYEVVGAYDPDRIQNLQERYNLDEPILINYYGYHNRFIHFEHDELSGNAKEALKDKIVVVGDYGLTFNNKDDMLDRYHTPMNKYGAGVGYPDMKGVLIHANIIQMLLDETIIVKVPKFINWIVSLIIAFFTIVVFSFYFVKRHLWFHIVAKVIQVVFALLLLLFSILLYVYANIKFEPEYLLLLVILSVDVLYFYEAIAAVLYKKFKIKSYFIHEH